MVDGTVAEIVTRPVGSQPLQRLYHPDILAQMRRVEGENADLVGLGWTYDEAGWSAPIEPEPPPSPIDYVPPSLARERLEQDGFWDEFSAILASNPAAMLKVLTLREGIDPADAQAVALIGASGASPARILAPPGTVLAPLAPQPDPLSEPAPPTEP